jgi:hypothetical protein
LLNRLQSLCCFLNGLRSFMPTAFLILLFTMHDSPLQFPVGNKQVLKQKCSNVQQFKKFFE